MSDEETTAYLQGVEEATKQSRPYVERLEREAAYGRAVNRVLDDLEDSGVYRVKVARLIEMVDGVLVDEA